MILIGRNWAQLVAFGNYMVVYFPSVAVRYGVVWRICAWPNFCLDYYTESFFLNLLFCNIWPNTQRAYNSPPSPSLSFLSWAPAFFLAHGTTSFRALLSVQFVLRHPRVKNWKKLFILFFLSQSWQKNFLIQREESLRVICLIKKGFEWSFLNLERTNFVEHLFLLNVSYV